MQASEINKSWIEAHIPHQGKMCLLEQVISWDNMHITCLTKSHQLLDNPLRDNNQLNAACGIEYAAQAMAIHGALLAPKNQEKPQAGFLVSIRGASIYRARLDNIKQALTINTELINSNENNLLYSFSLSADNALILEGRAAVMHNTESLLGTSI